MAKLYSEKLNKYYEMTEADLLAEEEAAYDAEIEAKEQLKADKEARLHEVEEAYDAAYEAHLRAVQLKDKFVEDYGSIRIKRSMTAPCGTMFEFNPTSLMNSLYDLFDF